MKRILPSDGYTTFPAKKLRRVHHAIAVRQLGAEDFTASDPDDEILVQLERAVSLVLAAVGFDGVKPDALESFRMHVDQCKLSQTSLVTGSNY